MAKRKGPTTGGRILVELPFGKEVKPVEGKKGGKSKFIKLKQNVASFLGLKPSKEVETRTVSIKTASGEVKATRVVNIGSYRRKSVTLLLSKARKIGKSPNTYKTVDLPLGSGCTVSDAVIYYQKNGPAKGIIGIRTPDGATYRWGVEK